MSTDPDCEFCCENKFVKDAQAAERQIPIVKGKISILRHLIKALYNRIDNLEPIKGRRTPERSLNSCLNKKVETSSRVQQR